MASSNGIFGWWPAILLQPGEAGAAHGTQQPGPTLAAPESAEVLKGPQVGFLHDILGIVVVAGQPAAKWCRPCSNAATPLVQIVPAVLGSSNSSPFVLTCPQLHTIAGEFYSRVCKKGGSGWISWGRHSCPAIMPKADSESSAPREIQGRREFSGWARRYCSPEKRCSWLMPTARRDFSGRRRGHFSYRTEMSRGKTDSVVLQSSRKILAPQRRYDLPAPHGRQRVSLGRGAEVRVRQPGRGPVHETRLPGTGTDGRLRGLQVEIVGGLLLLAGFLTRWTSGVVFIIPNGRGDALRRRSTCSLGTSPPSLPPCRRR